MNTQYSKAIDAIIYSKATKGFTKEEWLTLSNAAQDQAEIEIENQDKEEARILRRLYDDDVELHISREYESGWAIVDGARVEFAWSEDGGIFGDTLVVVR